MHFSSRQIKRNTSATARQASRAAHLEPAVRKGRRLSYARQRSSICRPSPVVA